jgi:hypothetical protein
MSGSRADAQRASSCGRQHLAQRNQLLDAITERFIEAVRFVIGGALTQRLASCPMALLMDDSRAS